MLTWPQGIVLQPLKSPLPHRLPFWLLPTWKLSFPTRFDDILSGIENVRKDITDCAVCVMEIETRVLTAEDIVALLQPKVQVQENKNKDLEVKLPDLETRSRRSNLRLVNIPEGAEGEDTCLSVGLAARLGLGLVNFGENTQNWAKNAEQISRMLIMKCLNFKDEELVVRAAKTKREVF